ncbi:hypothetical protein AVEN_193353-1 [Araneus ventricosus]|uniref:Uncharacterized protein n=1 Tax=Araneus ventricosus TaxID=182803 RepID=A0A4Y2ETH0_ARAVE|nr:hypothetical protein AVEN_193353-1 [Araneus ventricosus]
MNGGLSDKLREVIGLTLCPASTVPQTQKIYRLTFEKCVVYNPDNSISCLKKNGQESAVFRNTIQEMANALTEAFASVFSASSYSEPFSYA